MSIYIAIALGGSVGAVSRYWVSNTTYQWLGTQFSYGTLAVNLIGSLLMGFLTVMLVERLQVSDAVRLGILVGFLGSFTTFSTFSIETLNWINSGNYMKALAYIVVSVVTCVGGAWAGLITAKQIFLR